MHTAEQFETLVNEFDLLHETVVGFDAEWTRKATVWIFHIICRILYLSSS